MHPLDSMSDETTIQLIRTTPEQDLPADEPPPGDAAGRIPGNLGIWVGITCVFVEFAVLFIVYFVARANFPEAFHEGTKLLSRWTGTLITLLMISTSLCLAASVAMIRAGKREEVLASSAPWYCVSCYYCTVRCPQEVSITGIMYTLKSMAMKAGKHEETGGAELSQTFVDYVEGYGRSFELGLATRNFLQHNPRDMVRMASMGWGMLSRQRIDLTPHRIENLNQLQAILARAKEIEEVTA